MNKHVLLGIRVALGITFIVAAVGKLSELAKFVEVVVDYEMLPWELAQAYGATLPWLELVVGICLVTGLLSRPTAGVSILMVISFIVANSATIFEHEYCFCLGEIVFLRTSVALIVDGVMAVMASLIFIYGGGFWSLDVLIRAKLKRSASTN